MKRRKFAKDIMKGVSAVMVTLSSLAPLRAAAGTLTLPILANLVNIVQVTLNTSLDFGTLAMTIERPGTATIDPFVNKLFVDGNSSLSGAGGEPRAGRIEIRGPTLPIAISVEEPSIQLTNGATFVVVNDFNFNTIQGGSRVTMTPTVSSEPFLVPIGATINTREGQLSGTYTGSTRIFANFQ